MVVDAIVTTADPRIQVKENRNQAYIVRGRRNRGPQVS